MANRWETANRRVKANAIEAVLRDRNEALAEAGLEQVDGDTLRAKADDDEFWHELAAEAEVNPPSAATRALIATDADYNQIRHYTRADREDALVARVAQRDDGADPFDGLGF